MTVLIKHFQINPTINCRKLGSGNFPGSFRKISKEILRKEIKLMSCYAKNYSSQVPVRFETSSPNHAICLIHWQILCTFLRQFCPEKHHMFQRQLCDCSCVFTPDIPVIDSTFNLISCLQGATHLTVLIFFHFQLISVTSNFFMLWPTMCFPNIGPCDRVKQAPVSRFVYPIKRRSVCMNECHV